jgi:hypothetical protein
MKRARYSGRARSKRARTKRKRQRPATIQARLRAWEARLSEGMRMARARKWKPRKKAWAALARRIG